MKYALISTVELEQPYSFRQVCIEKPIGEFNGIFWIDLPEDSVIDPTTHIYTDSGFELKPVINSSENSNVITSTGLSTTVI